MKMNLLLTLFACVTCARLVAQTPNSIEPPLIPAGFSVWSQRQDMNQWAGKHFRLSVAIRAEPADSESFAVAFVRNEYPEQKARNWVWMDNMFDRPVRDTVWKTYVLEGMFDRSAPYMGWGVLGYGNGTFYFDDFQLSVETEPGNWQIIPLVNANFEQEGLEPWQQTSMGVPVRVLGASALIWETHPFEGKKCLRVTNKFLSDKD